MSLLLHAGASERAWDAAGRATPLHCAASAGSVACVRLLLAAGADVNAGLQAGCRSPLHCAVLSDAPDCVRKLLAAGACPNTPQVSASTALSMSDSQKKLSVFKNVISIFRVFHCLIEKEEEAGQEGNDKGRYTAERESTIKRRS